MAFVLSIRDSSGCMYDFALAWYFYRMIVEEWPTFFMYDMDEPRLNAYRPKAKPTDDDTADLEALNDRICGLFFVL